VVVVVVTMVVAEVRVEQSTPPTLRFLQVQSLSLLELEEVAELQQEVRVLIRLSRLTAQHTLDKEEAMVGHIQEQT
jgi:hypothetical protein